MPKDVMCAQTPAPPPYTLTRALMMCVGGADEVVQLRARAEAAEAEAAEAQAAANRAHAEKVAAERTMASRCDCGIAVNHKGGQHVLVCERGQDFEF